MTTSTDTNGSHNKNFRILVADDEIMVRNILEAYLDGGGYDVVFVEDGAAAVEILKKEEFSIVISDIQMPNIDGMELLRHIRKNHPKTDVIVMTGLLSKYSYNDVVTEGAIDYIQKPLQIEELEAKLNRVKRERNTIHELLKSRAKLEKKTAAEKEKLESRLLQAQKMEAIGVLAGGIAHDFNNILGVILGFAEMAKDLAPADSQIYNYIMKVLKVSNRAKNLVKQILTFSRQNRAENIIFKPAPLVKETLEFIKSSIPASITVRQNIRNDCSNIKADPTQFHRIVMNLCTNAYQAMEGSEGVLEVTLEEYDAKANSSSPVFGLKDGTYLKLQVSDTGPGIPPLVKNRIFEPYFTTKEIGKGTGMGLAVVHGIVENYDGMIQVESVLGGGATFTVYLPVIASPAQIAAEDVSELQRGHERILFIDEEEMLSELGKDMLEGLGYEVTSKTSSFAAMETFKDQPGKFDLVIADQSMSGITSADFVKSILQIRPDIPVILCTGYSQVVSEEEVKTMMGVKAFALKPLVKRDISKLIRKVLGEKAASVQ